MAISSSSVGSSRTSLRDQEKGCVALPEQPACRPGPALPAPSRGQPRARGRPGPGTRTRLQEACTAPFKARGAAGAGRTPLRPGAQAEGDCCLSPPGGVPRVESSVPVPVHPQGHLGTNSSFRTFHEYSVEDRTERLGGRSSGSHRPRPWTPTPTPGPGASGSSQQRSAQLYTHTPTPIAARAPQEGGQSPGWKGGSLSQDPWPAPCLPPAPCAPEQEVHCGYLVPGEGLQLAAAVPLVKEVLGGRRVEGGQWVPTLRETSLTSPPHPTTPAGVHCKPGSRACKATSSWEPQDTLRSNVRAVPRASQHQGSGPEPGATQTPQGRSLYLQNQSQKQVDPDDRRHQPPQHEVDLGPPAGDQEAAQGPREPSETTEERRPRRKLRP